MTAPMASGHASPIWPLPDVTRRRWTFGAPRTSKDGTRRRHAGVDLYAPRGSIVLAPESGHIIASQRFLGPMAVALLMQTDSGPVILFGEVEPQSWREFGRSIGSRVERGDAVARVGIAPKGGQMLHYEMYTQGTRQNAQWIAGRDPPPNLLDPTQYLRSAMALDTGQSDPDIQDDDDPAEDHDEDEDEDVVGDDPDVTKTGDWSGMTGFLLLLGALALLNETERG